MNRHAVYVWDPRGRALPTTIEEALKLGRDLSEIPEEASEHLLGFASDMERYANTDDCIDDEDVYAAIGNLKELLGGAAIEIDLSMVNSDRVLVELVDCGSRHGLVLVDDLINMAFLPKGKILPKSSAISWAVYKSRVESQTAEPKVENLGDYPKTLKAFIKWAEPFYSLEMSLMGFSEMGLSKGLSPERTFIRNVGYGKQHIIFNYCGKYPFFGVNFSFFITCDPVSSILDRFKFKRSADDYSVFLSLTQLTDFKLQHKQNAVFDGSLHDDVRLLREHVIKLLDDSIDIRGLDKMMNGNILSRSAKEHLKMFCPQRLVMAKLAGNPDIESLYAEFIGYEYWGKNEMARRSGEADKLMQYLRSEVNPLIVQ